MYIRFWICEIGQAIDHLGSRLQGNYFFQEQLSRHQTLMNMFDKDAFVALSHSVAFHGCTVKNEAFVGMGTTLLNGVVEKDPMVATGSLVR
ncbi:hypothetical protein RJT34_20226 [Clitoria ternatea]|uniref:Uncharacterized protein n=1 Tax=Clitoria ternatea TaxID=43366 RepID=A0AAN9P4Q0_CLITE